MPDSKSIHNPQSKIYNQDVRILLWDIDGTLLQSTRAGSFREYFAGALEKTYGTPGRIFEVKAAGITDTQIVFQALKDDGFTIEQVSARMCEFIDAMCFEMRGYINRHEDVYEILPGVREILQATAADPRFINALLTGNVGCGAKIKCRYIGVWQYFEKSLNTYGDVSHDRRQLAVTAGKNFDEYYKIKIDPAKFIVIGDTPHDIGTAKNFGAKIVSVETGRGIGREDLAAAQPDSLIKDLSNTQKVLRILEKF